jgi:Asp-tRNA(Asn)/Glu-tRNA(Gln) amidotransferase A subunit family amidase
MSFAEIAFLSAAELLGRYRRKELSPVEVVRAVLDRIDRYNGTVNAYCHVDAGAIGADALVLRASRAFEAAKPYTTRQEPRTH